MSKPTAVRWLISGRVQGVGYRWFTLRQAGALGVAGWVSNLPDGRVEVVAKGPPEALASLDGLLRAGPRLARVESVEKSDFPHQVESDKSFYVR